MRRGAATVGLTSAGAALALLCLALPAAADGVSATLITDYSHNWGTATDQSGKVESTRNDALSERLLFSVDRRLWPLLSFSGAGLLEQDWANSTPGGSLFDSSARAANLNATLKLAGPISSSAAGWTHRLSTSDSFGSRATLLLDAESLLLGWRPVDLPAFSLRLENQWTRDPTRTAEDAQSRLAQLVASWTVKGLSLNYSAAAINPEDRIAGSSQWTVAQALHAGGTGRAFGGRTTLSANLDVSDQRSKVGTLGAGATRTTQVLAAAGLSLVEAFPATPDLDQPVPNPALIDGLTTSSAGLNLGFGAALSGDLALRDLGAQFIDATAKVNLLWLWVDRRLPDSLAQSLAAGFAVYQSDDGLHWTQVPLAGAVRFGNFDNRFEIPIMSTAARNLKVVCRGLGAAVTTDNSYSDVFVTELQLFLVEALSDGQGWQGRSSGSAQLGARTAFTADLAHDLTLQLRSPLGSGGPGSWLATNGLSYARKLSRPLLFSARASRQDSDLGSGHRAENQLAASLAFTPLPTLSQSLTWSARWADATGGVLFTQGVSLFGRAQLYRGVGLQAGYGLNLGSDAQGRSGRGSTATTGVSLEPNPLFSMNGTYAHSDSRSSGGGKPDARSWGDSVTGGVSFRPFAALFASAGLSWLTGSDRRDTLLGLSVSASPFRDGDLQISCNYSETLQSGGVHTRILNPGVRWNLGTPIAQLSAGYTLSSTDTGVQRSTVNSFNANLQIRL